MTKWIKVLAVLCMWMALPTGCLAQEYYRVSDVYKQVQEKWKAEYKDSQGRVIPVDVNAEVYGNGTLSVSKVENCRLQIRRNSLSIRNRMER